MRVNALGANVALARPVRVPDVRAAIPGELAISSLSLVASDGIAARNSGARRLRNGSGIEDPMFLIAAQAVRSQMGGALNAGTTKCGMTRAVAGNRPLGVSLTHVPVVPAARILVIEENASDVFLLERALNKQDFRFELVRLLNGGQATAFIRRQGAYAAAVIPDLILMDLNPSRCSGEDLLREIRSARHLVGVPVCVWSSSQAARDETLLRSLGVCRFITKPSGLDQFMKIGKIIKDLLAAPRPVS